jgi:hypothetical protein
MPPIDLRQVVLGFCLPSGLKRARVSAILHGGRPTGSSRLRARFRSTTHELQISRINERTGVLKPFRSCREFTAKIGCCGIDSTRVRAYGGLINCAGIG